MNHYCRKSNYDLSKIFNDEKLQNKNDSSYWLFKNFRIFIIDLKPYRKIV